jgi:hypothetical protein
MADRVLYFGREGTLGTVEQKAAANTVGTGFRVPVRAARSGGTVVARTSPLDPVLALDGWIDVDGDTITYPDLDRPTNLPFSGYLLGLDDFTGHQRVIVGENAEYIGPFSHAEAVRIHWGIRQAAVEAIGFIAATPNTECADTPTSTTPAAPAGTELSYVVSPAGQHNTRGVVPATDDYYVSQPSSNVEWAWEQSSLTASVTIDINDIAYDIEEEEFFFRFSASALLEGVMTNYVDLYNNATKWEQITISSTPRIIPDDYTDYYTWFPPETGLPYYGDGEDIYVFSPFETTVDFDFGSALGTKTQTITGWRMVTVGRFGPDYGDAPAPVGGITLDVGSLTWRASLWWPYANTQGQPVWNEDTGDQLVDPTS